MTAGACVLVFVIRLPQIVLVVAVFVCLLGQAALLIKRKSISNTHPPLLLQNTEEEKTAKEESRDLPDRKPDTAAVDQQGEPVSCVLSEDCFLTLCTAFTASLLFLLLSINVFAAAV